MLKRTLMGYDEGYACCSSSESDQMDPGRPCRFFTRGGGCDYRQDCAFWHDENDDARLVHWDERIDRDFRDATSTSKEVRGYGISEATLRLVAEDLASRTLWPLTGISVKDALPYIALSDLSPEELRWEAYQEIRETGACAHYTQRLKALRAASDYKRKLVGELLWKPEVAGKLFAGGRLENAKEKAASADLNASINKKLAYLEAINVLSKPAAAEMAGPIPAPYEPAKQPRVGIIEVFCAVLSHAGIFPIDIDASDSVGDLKDAIKQQKRRLVRCDADQLKLFTAKRAGSSWPSTDDAKDGDAKLLMEGKTSQGVQALLMHGEMDPTFEIGDYLDATVPTKRVIHVLIQLPQSVEAKIRKDKPATASAVVAQAVITAEKVPRLPFSDRSSPASAAPEQTGAVSTLMIPVRVHETSPDTEPELIREAPSQAGARGRYAKKSWPKKRKKN